MRPTQPGYFLLVVGPSGAGKDSLMDAAKQRLPAEQFVFAKRVVTRPPGMVGEDYESCDPATFNERKAQGEFLATWQAHGYQYGLPASLLIDQARGKHIVANGSRASVPALAANIPNLAVIHVTAPVDMLAKRLAIRGRETEPQIRERLSRGTQQNTEFETNVRVVTVHNDASLQTGIERFLQAIATVVQS